MLDAQKLGIIDLESVKEKTEMAKRNELLSNHKYAITEGKDGRWVTVIYVEGVDGQPVRKMIRKSTREAVEDALVEFYREQAENPTVSEVFTEWNDRRLKLKQISASTHGRYKQCFNRHFSEFGKRKIKSLERWDIVDFLEEQIPEHGLNSKSFSSLKGITTGILKHAMRKGYVSFSTSDVFDLLDLSEAAFSKKVKEDSDEVFTDEEMEKIIDYLENNLDTQNTALLLMCVTGLRVGEVAALKHTDFSENSVKIERTETRFTDANGKIHYEIKNFPKTAAGVRNTLIPQDYQWIIRRTKSLNPFGEFVFTNSKGERMTCNCFRERFYRVCKKVGIKPRSTHKIRKTYASIMLDSNVDRRLIMSQMGHTDISITEQYYHRDRRDVDEKLHIISNIPEFRSRKTAIM